MDDHHLTWDDLNHFDNCLSDYDAAIDDTQLRAHIERIVRAGADILGWTINTGHTSADRQGQ
jgi:hypothetical protein